MCSGPRYFGSPRPGDMFTTKTPIGREPVEILDDSCLPFVGIRPVPTHERLDSAILARGVLKLAAASRTDGTVICCQGCCAGNTAANSGQSLAC